MSFTYDTLKAAIFAWTTESDQDSIGDGSMLVDNIDLIMSLGLRRVQRDLELEVFTTTATGVISTGSYLLARPVDMIEVQSFHYQLGTRLVPLQRRSYDFVIDYWPILTNTGTMLYYAESDLQGIRVAPTTSGSRTYFLRYLARIQPLSSANQSNWISLNQGDLLLFACLEESEAFLHEDAQGRVALWKGKYEGQLPKAISETASLTRVTGERGKMSGVNAPPAEIADGR